MSRPTKRKKTTHIVIHTSASNDNATYKDINNWHRTRGFLLGGYHRLFYPDGTVILFDEVEMMQFGRMSDEIGAHADVSGKPAFEQFNYRSIGYCWIGGLNSVVNITEAQIDAMLNQITLDMNKYPDIKVENIVGHNEIPGVHKGCPLIDMNGFRALVDLKIGRSVAEKVEVEDENGFIDLDKNRWSYESIMWAVRTAKIFNGIEVSDGKYQFAPDSPVSREQLAVILHRYTEYLGGKI